MTAVLTHKKKNIGYRFWYYKGVYKRKVLRFLCSVNVLLSDHVL